jgi:hypothetical protein
VDLNPVPNPADVELRKNPANNVGGVPFYSAMTAESDGLVHVYPSPDNEDLTRIVWHLVHESGHELSQRILSDGGTDKGWSAWLKAMSDDGGMAVSGYAKVSLDEDFAEAWALWQPARGTPHEAEVARLIPHRVRIMQAMIETGMLPPEQSGPAGHL